MLPVRMHKLHRTQNNNMPFVPLLTFSLESALLTTLTELKDVSINDSLLCMDKLLSACLAAHILCVLTTITHSLTICSELEVGEASGFCKAYGRHTVRGHP
jgi:hypothetical protein